LLTIVHLRQHRRRIRNSYSSTERVNLLWLLWLSAAAAAIWLLAIAVDVASTLPFPMSSHPDDLVSFAVVLLVYAIGYMGLRQPEIFRYDGPAAPPPSASDPPSIALAAQADADAPAGRYERSGLRDAEAVALKESLIALMTREHPYRDPDLTLPDLAERLGTTPHKLSEVLNSELSQTFYDFVNSYRVDDVRRRLAKAESKQVNVLALAMDAGFASKSTFNQVFKKQTGQTPSAYRQAVAG